MCNLYRLRQSPDEVADYCDVSNGMRGANVSEHVFPGQPGAVVEGNALRQMSWGFPLTLKGKNGRPLKPKPVNNARTDKLGGAFWSSSFRDRRCLIPLSAWAEAQGEKGAKTRTWLSRPDAPIFTVAGIWRDSEEWGRVYSMIMTDADGPAADVHARMPVLLTEDERDTWLGGNREEALALCGPWYGELAIEATDEPWAGRR